MQQYFLLHDVIFPITKQFQFHFTVLVTEEYALLSTLLWKSSVMVWITQFRLMPQLEVFDFARD